MLERKHETWRCVTGKRERRSIPTLGRLVRFGLLVHQVDSLTTQLNETSALAEELHGALRAEQAAKANLQVRERRRV